MGDVLFLGAIAITIALFSYLLVTSFIWAIASLAMMQDPRQRRKASNRLGIGLAVLIMIVIAVVTQREAIANIFLMIQYLAGR